ncbi:MAG: hypothetical protein ACOVP1_09100 [Bacteroidia bacterium]
MTPIVILGKAAKLKTWTSITSVEIFAWTLILSYMNPKRIVPRINEGYIYAYTLFHWYLLIETIANKGPGFWLSLVFAISIYPTFLIVKSALEHKKLSYRNKLILYYWFLFAIVFTYIDQVSLNIIKPILELYEVNFMTTIYVLITGVQLYFISTSFSLLFVGIPIFHLDKSSNNWKVKWAQAMKDWKDIVNHKLGNFVEYQISLVQFFYITMISAGLFYLDYSFNIRLYLIFFYTVVFPLIFFYLKYTPEDNLEYTEDKISN